MNKGVNVEQTISALLELNREHSKLFVAEHLDRVRYRVEHSTEFAALKCMDGRIHLPLMTKTPLGIIQPWRNLGGRFDLGWPFFQETLLRWVNYSIGRGRRCVIFVTYHFSRGELHRGCRGFNYDKDAAFAAAKALKHQCEEVFGKTVVFPILCGIETDLDAMILHGDSMEVDLSEIRDLGEAILDPMLQNLYPGMLGEIRRDLIPLVQGNIAHIGEVRAKGRSPADADHKEWVLGIGRGFDWLHAPNTALIVGPYDPSLDDAIETAARLLKSNIDDGRIQIREGNGLVLLTSAPYREGSGPEKNLAREKARYLGEFAWRVIKDHVPELVPHLTRLSGTVYLETREFTPLEV